MADLPTEKTLKSATIPIEIPELPFRDKVTPTMNFPVEELGSAQPTGRTSFKVVQDYLTGKIEEKNFMFPTGDEVAKRLKKITDTVSGLSMADINNTDNVPVWQSAMSELLKVEPEKFNQLRYNCCLVASNLPDFPEELKETDNFAFLFTDRNKDNGIQQLIGAKSGYIFNRRMLDGKISEWIAMRGHVTYYAVFDIDPDTGLLSMTTKPGYEGADFSIEDDHLIVII